MNTKSVLITGGNTGLGYQAAKNLAAAGWYVMIASRNITKTTNAAEQLRAETGNMNVLPLQLDLGSLADVRRFAEEFATLDIPPLHAIVCNAGITLTGLQYSAEGYEKMFAVNHLGHFLLVNLLLNYLQTPGRVVMVSSGTHIPEHRLARVTGVPIPNYVTARDLAFPEQAPEHATISNPAQAYSTSKLTNVLFAYELSRKLGAQGIDGINTYALDPGLMPDTDFVREFPAVVRAIFRAIFVAIEPLVAGIRRVEQSGKDLARLVTDPGLANVTATYYDGHKEEKSSADSYDVDKARDLWETSVELTNLQPEETIFQVNVAVV